jgi:hypothetical protein
MTNGVRVDVSNETPEIQFYGTGERRKPVLDALHKFKGQPAPVRKYHAAVFGEAGIV